MKRALLTATVVLALLPIIGCNNDAPKLSDQEKSEFKGGPMPESARQIMAEKMKAAGVNQGTRK